MSVPRIPKRQLEKARQEKAAAKRERRHQRGKETGGDESSELAEPGRSESDVLDELTALHEEFAAGRIAFADFEPRRDELAAELADCLER